MKQGSRFWRHAVWVALAALSLAATAARAGDVSVAVATNFATTMQDLATAFTRETGHQVRLSAGSTGKHYAQIRHGAPFDVFLAADTARPALLEEAGLIVPGSRRTYAVGRLVLWRKSPDRSALTLDRVAGEPKARLALANPDLAPYGAAAEAVLRATGHWDTLRDRIVLGENVGQAYAMAATGNADYALVALSLVLSAPPDQQGAHWAVPETLHPPIRQDMVVLARAQDNPAARALATFITSAAAQKIIVANGYRSDHVTD